MARDAGWFPIGVELTTKFAESARREFGIQVYNEKVEDIAFADQRFDLVTLLDVYEHLQDPNAVLQAVHKTMNDDNYLLIEVPNVTFIRLKVFGLSLLFGNDAHTKHDFVNPLGYWMAQEHLYNFSDKTLQKLLLKNGFKKRKSYIEFPSIYGAYFWRDAAQIVVWISSVVVRFVTFGYLNVGRSLVYVFMKS